MKIAWRFNAGQMKERSRVLEGRLNGRAIPPQCLQHPILRVRGPHPSPTTSTRTTYRSCKEQRKCRSNTYGDSYRGRENSYTLTPQTVLGLTLILARAARAWGSYACACARGAEGSRV
jgi:hypothetical protein